MHSKQVILKNIIIIIVSLAILTHVKGLFNDYVLDDFDFLQYSVHKHFQDVDDYFTTTSSQHYSPLYYLVNMYLFQALHEYPFILRSINLVLFILTAILMFICFSRITSHMRVSLLATILFCVHPLNAHCVNYITCNFIFLVTIFGLLTLLSYWHFMQSKRIVLIISAYVFFLLSLMSFEGAMLLPLYLAVLLRSFAGRSWKEIFQRCLPFLIMSMSYFVLWIILAGQHSQMLERIGVLNLTPYSYVATLFVLFAWYIGQLFLPVGVVLIYNIMPLTSNVGILLVSSLLFLFSLVLIYRHFGLSNMKSFGFGWFLVGFLLVLPATFAHAYMGMVIEPHWLFFPSMGIFILLASMLEDVFGRFHRNVNIGIYTIILLLLVLASHHLYRRTGSQDEFNAYWLEKAPNSVIAMANLGTAAATKGDHERALAYFHRAMDYVLYDSPKQYLNVGILYFEQGQFEKAKKYLLHSLHLQPRAPQAYNILGLIAGDNGDREQAKSYFRYALAEDPFFLHAVYNLNSLFLMEGAYERSEELLSLYMRKKLLKKDHLTLRAKLSLLNFIKGDVKEAMDIMESLIKANPGPDAYILLIREYHGVGLHHISTQLMETCEDLYPNDLNVKFLRQEISVDGKGF